MAEAAAVFRRGPDAVSADHARYVQGFAVLAAAAVASGDRAVAVDSGRETDGDRGGDWRTWEVAEARRRAPAEDCRRRQQPAHQQPITSHQPPTTASAPPPASVQASGPWRDRLHAAMLEMGMQFTADAVEHSQVTEVNGELQFVTPEEFRLAMNETEILKVVQKIAGRPMRIKIALGKPDAVPAPIAKPKDEVTERALSHPEVKRFQEMFPDAQVRAVRN